MSSGVLKRGIRVSGPRFVIVAIWVLLLATSARGIVRGNHAAVFAGLGTFCLTLLPAYFSRRLRIAIPVRFVAAIAAFLYAAVVLGGLGHFYDRYWWWDVMLHGGSAIGFGLIGTVLVLTLARGDKLRAAPFVASLLAFCFAVTIGVVWEIWEFALDQTLGLNTQESGLVDTMWDLIVNCLGAALGAGAGYADLKGWRGGPLAATIRDFVARNRRFFPEAE